MKRITRRLPIPQHEFGFAADTFRLFSETGLDGERLTRERAEAEQVQKIADAEQTTMFARIQPKGIHE